MIARSDGDRYGFPPTTLKNCCPKLYLSCWRLDLYQTWSVLRYLPLLLSC